MATHRAGRRQNKIERLSEPHITIARYVVKCLYLKISLSLPPTASLWERAAAVLSIVNKILKVKS